MDRLHSTVESMSQVLTWPFVAFLIFLILAFCSPAARRISSIVGSARLKKLKFGSAEIEFSVDASRELKQTVDQDLALLKKYRQLVDKEVDRQVSLFGIEAEVRQVVETKLRPLMKDRHLPKGFRLTIHVPDFLFRGRLYQLLPYYPSGRGEHRDFSMRQGIIGKVWRSGVDECVGNLIPPQVREGHVSEEEQVKYIAQHWGFDLTEARSALEKKSYCCLVLRDDSHQQMALIYFDCPTANAMFEDELRHQFCSLSASAFQQSVVPKLIQRTLEEMRPFSPRIAFQ